MKYHARDQQGRNADSRVTSGRIISGLMQQRGPKGRESEIIVHDAQWLIKIWNAIGNKCAIFLFQNRSRSPGRSFAITRIAETTAAVICKECIRILLL
jgi:hypothetical protein